MLTAYADAFLGDIQDSPEDDVPRLIYADWLEEQDEPERAELIRLQCALASEALPSEERAAAQARERELLAWGRLKWAGPLARLVRSYEFRRGFIERVQLDSTALVKHGDEVFRLAPVCHLELTVRRGASELVADCSLLSRLRALDLNYPSPDPEGLAALLASPYLTGLRWLRLRLAAGGLGPGVLQAARRLSELTLLDLGTNPLPGHALGALLAQRWPALSTLHLNSTGLADGEVMALADSPLLPGLTALDLSYNSIGPAGARALSCSSGGAGLLTLWLGFNHVSDAGAQVLAAGRFSLTRLYLGRNYVGLAGAQALATSPHLAGLAHLDLDYNDLPPAALQALIASPHLTALEALYLRCGRGPSARLQRLLERRFGAGVCRF